MNDDRRIIGVMDSGVGGISVLRTLRAILPNELFVYLGDRTRSPYGNKPPDLVRKYVTENARTLNAYGCKALVIACNTATAVAISELRTEYANIPVIGLEPALQPALRKATENNGGNILLLATELTLKQKRFLKLCDSLCERYGAKIITEENLNDAVILGKNNQNTNINVHLLSAQRIVEFIENKRSNKKELTEYLGRLFSIYKELKFDFVVLGCTHFPFAAKEIREALGYDAEFFDGSLGAANRLKTLLSQKDLFEKGILCSNNNLEKSGGVIWLSPNDENNTEYLSLMRELLHSKQLI